MSKSEEALFLANPEAQTNYGGLFNYYEGRLSAYAAVLVVTDKEIQIMRDHKIDFLSSTPDQMRVALWEMYPDQPLDKLLPRDKDVEHFMIVASNFEGNSTEEEIDVYMGAASIATGSPDAVTRVGILGVPQKWNLLPEDMAGIPEEQRRTPTSDAAHERRSRDTAAMTIGHELHHLIEDAEENLYTLSSVPGTGKQNKSQIGETYADRGVLADLPGLVKAGLVSSMDVALDYISERQILTYTDIVRAKPVSAEDLKTGKETQIELREHDTGFSLTSGDTLRKQEASVRETGTQLNDIYQKALAQMYKDAGDGRSTPEANKVYEETMKKTLFGEPTAKKSPEQHTQEEKYRRALFNQAMFDTPGFINQIADQIQSMPSAGAGVAMMAKEYLMAIDRLSAPKAEIEVAPAIENRPETSRPVNTLKPLVPG